GLHEDRAFAVRLVHLEVAGDQAFGDAAEGAGRVAIAEDRRAGGGVVAQREERQVLGVDAEQGDVVGLVRREDFAHREEAAVGGHHAHRFGVGGCGHVMVGRDDAFRRDGEAGGERVVPLRALVALIGGTDEHGRPGSAPIDLRAIKRRARSRADGEADRVGAGAFTLLQTIRAADGHVAFLGERVGLLFEFPEQFAVVRRAVDVDARDRRGAEDAGREQRGEKHAGIEAEARRETRQSMRIRREHTGRWRTCDGEREAWLAAA
ncbi:MAG: hypothetical protein AN484_23470, partial [Aphanizomenon flos-aquae WA102]